jgi:hypothetical protein
MGPGSLSARPLDESHLYFSARAVGSLAGRPQMRLSPPLGRRAVTLDRVDDLAVAALLALHADRNDRMDGRDEQQGVKKEKPEDKAGNNQDQIEKRRENLPVKEESQWGYEDRKNVDHGSLPLRPECRCACEQNNGRARLCAKLHPRMTQGSESGLTR